MEEFSERIGQAMMIFLILVGLFVIIRPKLALHSFVFLAQKVATAAVICLILALPVGIYCTFAHTYAYWSNFPAGGFFAYWFAPAAYGWAPVTMLLIVIGAFRLAKRRPQ
jgi:hypothetical protein